MYKGCPTFLTVRYGIGYIHGKTTGNDTEITIQWTDADGKEQIKPARTQRGARMRAGPRRRLMPHTRYSIDLP